MYYLYCYTSPSGKKYVGITDCIKRRQQEHSKKEFGCKKNTTKFAQAIRKYGYRNFTFEVIGKSKHRDVIEEFEIYYIDVFDSIKNGYNLATGGSYGRAPNKFTPETIMEIDKHLQEGKLSYTQIRSKYGISPAMLNKIQNRRAWSDILGPKVERTIPYKKAENNPSSKITQEIADNIRQELAQGIKRSDVKRKYGVSKSLIQQIATNKIWVK